MKALFFILLITTHFFSQNFLYSNIQLPQKNITPISEELQEKERPEFNRSMMVGSIVFFSLAYSGAIIGDVAVKFNLDFPELFVPVIGPWVATFRSDSFNRKNYWPNKKSEKFLIGLSAIIQTICVINFSIEIYQRAQSNAILYDHNSNLDSFSPQNKLSIQPLGMLGIQIVYQQ